uniref:Ig-like domain-containing protein n=1 Tax=Mola mola TaxID=94237 RepID=A0A3Q4B651_MOLML
MLQGSGAHPLPTQRSWPSPNPWAQLPLVTNQPEITAETMKPSSTVSGATGNSRFTLSNPHLSHHHQTHHGPRFEVFKNGTFVIKNIQLQDKGQYLCTAQNRFGSDHMVITLAVQMEAPRIQLPKATEITAYLGKSVTFDCFASGKPPAKVSWILPDRTFVREVGTIHTPLSPIALLQNGTLHIHSPDFSSKGNYKCIAMTHNKGSQLVKKKTKTKKNSICVFLRNSVIYVVH